jgi:hypothetical protein
MATSRFVPDGAPDGFFLQNDGGRGLEGNWGARGSIMLGCACALRGRGLARALAPRTTTGHRR